MYVATWPSLAAHDLFRPATAEAPPFPFSAPHRLYSYVARNGIYQLFRALRFKAEDVVLVPDYHSGVEVWAMRAAGASLRYYRIDRAMEPDLDELRLLCASGAKVLYVIHYLGWPQPMAEITAMCAEHGMILIEDCALSLLSEPQGRPLGSTGDYAVFCLYKTLPIPNGGLLIGKAPLPGDLARLDQRACGAASVAGRGVELMLEGVRSRSDSLGRTLQRIKRGAGAALTSFGVARLPVGDIPPTFDSAGFRVDRMNLAMSAVSGRLLGRFDYPGIRRRRRDNYQLLHSRLEGAATLLPKKRLDEGICPLFFPILVPDKHAAASALWQRGISAVEFWNYGDPRVAKDESTEARFLRDHVLELPIHQDVTGEQIEFIADEVLGLGLRMPSGTR